VIDGDEGVSVAPSTELLLFDNPSEMLRRAAENVRLLTTRLMDVSPTTAETLVAGFSSNGLVALNAAIADRMRATRRRQPLGLAFHDVRLSVDRTFERQSLSIGEAAFVDSLDFRATGVVFDVQGSGVVHRARPGIFVDTGERGAMTADRLIEMVRNDLPDFGSGDDTENVVVLIRADKSIFSAHQGSGETLDFDLIIPFRTDKRGARDQGTRSGLNVQT
jgi:hypothetical protein